MNETELKQEIHDQKFFLGHDSGEYIGGVFFPCGVIQELIDQLNNKINIPETEL